MTWSSTPQQFQIIEVRALLIRIRSGVRGISLAFVIVALAQFVLSCAKAYAIIKKANHQD
ncbi:hypothetical protein LPAF129_02420 [Ligilactobacillus pabuli]|uniref:Uncharacterized protein n=1 Tax=Ligilactobacillus pabuli TaxID=2886039 RepID=A0ABQ5JG83_9LACO|nr:hypothetical protein LPAF129_02420 [Ligilactobacillus pabuli]